MLSSHCITVLFPDLPSWWTIVEVLRLHKNANTDRQHQVDAYKSIIAYHAGDGVWVEMDIMLDEKTQLSRAHDVAETLQYCLEGLSEVDRAFVSVDYTSQGPTGHAET